MSSRSPRFHKYLYLSIRPNAHKRDCFKPTWTMSNVGNHSGRIWEAPDQVLASAVYKASPLRSALLKFPTNDFRGNSDQVIEVPQPTVKNSEENQHNNQISFK